MLSLSAEVGASLPQQQMYRKMTTKTETTNVKQEGHAVLHDHKQVKLIKTAIAHFLIKVLVTHK